MSRRAIAANSGLRSIRRLLGLKALDFDAPDKNNWRRTRDFRHLPISLARIPFVIGTQLGDGFIWALLPKVERGPT